MHEVLTDRNNSPATNRSSACARTRSEDDPEARFSASFWSLPCAPWEALVLDTAPATEGSEGAANRYIKTEPVLLIPGLFNAWNQQTLHGSKLIMWHLLANGNTRWKGGSLRNW